MARVEGRQNFALGAGAVVVLLLAGALAWTFSGKANRPAAPAPMAAAPIGAAEVAPAPGGFLFFEAGLSRLPAEALDTLGQVADAARATEGAMVEISANYPSTGDAAVNAKLATERAQAVRHALEANGVAPRRMRVRIAQAQPGADPRQANRVELRLR